jgi:hypothetical protein
MAGQPVLGGGKNNLWNIDPKAEQERQQRIIELLAKIAGYSATTARAAGKPSNTKVQGSGKTRGNK